MAKDIFNFDKGRKTIVTDNLLKSYGIDQDQQTIEKSDESTTGDSLEKGGKRAVIGEKREFSGRMYIKTAQGWKFFGKGTGNKAQDHHNSAASHDSKEDKKTQTYLDAKKQLEKEGYLKDSKQEDQSKKQDFSNVGDEPLMMMISNLGSATDDNSKKLLMDSLEEATKRGLTANSKKEIITKPLSEYKRNEIVNIEGSQYKLINEGSTYSPRKWAQLDEEGKTLEDYYWDPVNINSEIINGYWYGPEGQRQKRALLKQHATAQAKYNQKKLTLGGEIEEKYFNTSNPQLASTLEGKSIIFQNEDGKNVKGILRFNPETNDFRFIGKVKGGKDNNIDNLSIEQAGELANKNLVKIDENATSIHDFVKVNAKEFKTKKNGFYKEQFFEDYYSPGRKMNDKEREAIQQLIGTSDNGVWKKLSEADISDISEIEIDSRFSNEREGYVGMFSGDLNHTAKWSAIIDGVLYQRVGTKSYDTKGFW